MHVERKDNLWIRMGRKEKPGRETHQAEWQAGPIPRGNGGNKSEGGAGKPSAHALVECRDLGSQRLVPEAGGPPVSLPGDGRITGT